MRKVSLILASLVLVGIVGGVLAQETELPDPGLTPDSPLYFLEIISEGIGTFFTFGDLKKAERYAALAAERVAEAQAVVEKGRPEFAERALRRYEAQLNQSLARAERAKARGQKIEKVTEIVAKATSKHLPVLEGVLERVPEEAREAITKALERSKTGHITALKALAGENPGRAVEINIDSARGRLEKAKLEAAKKNKEGVEKALEDYEDFQTTLEEVRGKGKVLGALVGEARIRDIEDLDEIEDKAEDISAETENRVKEAKNRSIERQMASLRDVASEDPERATEINLRAAEARLRRAEAKAEEEPEEVEEVLNEFEAQYKFGEEISEIAKGLGKDTTTVEQLVGKATSIHLEILATVYEKVPEEAKPTIEKAMEVSARGHERVIEALKRKEALGEIPEEVPLPERIPEEIKAEIRERMKRPELPLAPERPEVPPAVERPKEEEIAPERPETPPAPGRP